MPTLQEYTSFVFGESINLLDPDVIPKEIDVIRYMIHCFDVSQAEVARMVRKKRRAAVIKIVVGAVEQIWKNKSLPIKSNGAIYWKVDSLFDRVEYVKVSKSYHENNVSWIQEIVKNHDKVFDISMKPVEVKPDDAMEVDLPETVPEEVLAEPEEILAEPVQEMVLGKRKRKIPDRYRQVIIIIYWKLCFTRCPA